MAFGEDQEQRLYGFYYGSVVDENDPEKLGRVKVQIPGLIEPESDWAVPAGFPGSGSRQRGLFAPPHTGATVIVGFIQGDIDEPFYLCGPWGLRQGQTGIPTAPAAVGASEASSVPAFETESFECFVSDIPRDRRLVLRVKRTGDQIELDARDNSISIVATSGLNLFATGIIDITAHGGVQIQGRTVNPSLFGKQI